MGVDGTGIVSSSPFQPAQRKGNAGPPGGNVTVGSGALCFRPFHPSSVGDGAECPPQAAAPLAAIASNRKPGQQGIARRAALGSGRRKKVPSVPSKLVPLESWMSLDGTGLVSSSAFELAQRQGNAGPPGGHTTFGLGTLWFSPFHRCFAGDATKCPPEGAVPFQRLQAIACLGNGVLPGARST